MTEEIFEKFGDEPSIEDVIALKTILEMLTKTARKKEGEG